MFFFFLFKPAISLLEQVRVIIFPPSVSRVARGVHGHQAIVFLQLHISTVDREVHHSKHKMTPFLFEAGRPGRRVRAYTLRLRKFRSCARTLPVLVRARTKTCMCMDWYIHMQWMCMCTCVHNYITYFLRGFAPKEKMSGTSVKIISMKWRGI